MNNNSRTIKFHNSNKTVGVGRKNLKQFVAIFIALAILITATPLVFAQTKKKKKTKPKIESQDQSALNAKKKDLQSQIDLANKLLKETRRTKTLSLAQLVALNKKIEVRESLIGEISSEINGIDLQIADKNANVIQLDTEIAQLKRSYARMIVYAYRNQDAYQRMMFIFSAADFNQAFLRMRYMQQIGESRREQAEKIADRQQQLNENIRALEDQKAQKKDLLGSNESEKQQLAEEKDDKDKTFRALQSKEDQLKSDLAKKKAESASIDNAIQALIAAEAERAAAAAAKAKAAATKANPTATNPTNPTKPNPTVGNPTKPVPTPQPTDPMGNSFASSQGKIIWPVAEGTITSHFGKQPHPVLKDVYVNNNGIDIATNPDASARAVFDGEVTGVTNIPGSGWLVIIRHGDYLTVYAKLEEVFVKQGDKVTAKQNIGKVSKDADEGQSILHFEVWKSGVGKVDPEAWLLKR